MAQYDLNNLELDDNQYDLLPEGAYHFRVERHEIDYYSGSSEKVPAGCQQIITHLEIPYTSDTGSVKTVSIKNTMNVYAKMLGVIRSFAECIGLCEEKGKFTFDVNKIDGRDGICEVSHRDYNGSSYNNITTCYSPSSAPKKCLNADEWKQYKDNGGFVEPNPGEIPDSLFGASEGDK